MCGRIVLTFVILSQGPLMNWLKVNFSQTFSAYLKALPKGSMSVYEVCAKVSDTMHYYCPSPRVTWEGYGI